MSLRIIRKMEDEILRKHSKDVLLMDEKTKTLIEDMKETMSNEGGCGLAAVQVGILKKIIVCQPVEDGEISVLINPEIVSASKEMVLGDEGCLSIKGIRGKVLRPSKIEVKAKNELMEDINFEATELYARIICHEIDHLNGILFTDIADQDSIERVDTN